MRHSKELVVLLALLLASVAFVLWYVADRRARQAAAPTPQPKSVGPLAPSTPPAEPVDLTKVDGQTIDFSSGQPVVRNSAEDQAAIDAAKKEMDAALAEAFAPAPKSEPAKP